MTHPFLFIAGGTLSIMLVAAGVLHLIPYLGSAGRAAAVRLCRAPGLDAVVFFFTGLPLVVGPILAGWKGLGAAVVGQLAMLIVWTILHELTHPAARKRPRIVTTINRNVGAWRNLLAVYWTAIVTPMFLVVRLAEIAVYPALTWLVGLPAYRAGDWVSVSRQKFSGLIGHDLIWCLYCDWMTGVWSLGSEMLRNVESFWCPIRFRDDKKCANCSVDFPDLDHGWVDADGTIEDVARTLEEKYPPGQPIHAWFGHPVRLRVRGKPYEPAAPPSPPRDAKAVPPDGRAAVGDGGAAPRDGEVPPRDGGAVPRDGEAAP